MLPPHVPRTSPFSSSVFHAARTLSGSLRSPPSPRGEGFVRRYSFSKYACIRSDVIGKAVFSFYSLYRWRSEPCFCMTAEQPLEEGARRRRRMDPHSGKK